MRNAYKILVGRAERMKKLRKLKCRWENSIQMDLKEIGWVCMEWMDSSK
jgi:hypothetical protein